MAFKNDEYFVGAECDHLNKDTTDNRLSNLRWLSHSDNCIGRNIKPEKDRPLYLVFDDGSVEMYSCRRHTNIPSPTLSKILNKGQHSQKYRCRGFYWDKLHEQSKQVQQLVTDYSVSNMLF